MTILLTVTNYKRYSTFLKVGHHLCASDCRIEDGKKKTKTNLFPSFFVGWGGGAGDEDRVRADARLRHERDGGPGVVSGGRRIARVGPAAVQQTAGRHHRQRGALAHQPRLQAHRTPPHRAPAHARNGNGPLTLGGQKRLRALT